MSVIFKKTRGFSIAFMTDMHIGQSVEDQSGALLSWITGYSLKPVACIFGGDMTIGEHNDGNPIPEWLSTYGWDDSIIQLPTIGNHDTRWGISVTSYAYADNDSPHELIKSAYSSLFNGKEWYKWDYQSIRVLVMCNNVDTTGNGYHNCNPPGYTGSGTPNPDYSGFNTSGSEQWNWVLENCDSFDGTFLIGVSHRGVYAPFDRYSLRQSNYLARTGLIREATLRGMSVLLQGDQHIGFVGKKYFNHETGTGPDDIIVVHDVTGVGLWPFELPGGYVCRQIDLNELPGTGVGTHYLYASGIGSTDRRAAAMIMTFHGDTAYFEIAQNYTGDPADTYITYSGTIWRNPGQ